MTKFKVCAFDGSHVWDEPFDTCEEAVAEIFDHCRACEEAVRLGHMTDAPDTSDFYIVDIARGY
jgi:hypothetical protein